jgi:tetraprenyl-beta-curcumene synthase
MVGAFERQVRCLRELSSLARLVGRFFARIHPLARAELGVWRQAAAAIPDGELREQALATLRNERLSTAGAALFAATRAVPDPALVRALVAFQVTWDYLDTLAEQPADDVVANGMVLHRALVDALRPPLTRTDYYHLHRASDDGGYLEALVDVCGESCAALPAYEQVAATAAREASRAEVQGINHAPPSTRDAALQSWAAPLADAHGLQWFELAAASSSSLVVLALLAAAADAGTTAMGAEEISAAYFPWIDGLTTLLDSHVDRREDALSGSLSFVAHYRGPAAVEQRLAELTAHAFASARALPHGELHVVLVAGMIAMHLSRASAWTPEARPATVAVLRAAPAIVRPLLQVLRIWRLLRGERIRWGVAGESLACRRQPLIVQR